MSVSNKSDQDAMEDENAENIQDNSQNIENEDNNHHDQQDQNDDEAVKNQEQNDQQDGDADDSQKKIVNENENDEEYEEIKYDKNENEDENKENENNGNDLEEYNEDQDYDDEDQVGQKRHKKDKKLKKKKQQQAEEDQQAEPESIHPITQKIRQITYQIKKKKNANKSNLVSEYAEIILKEMEDLYQKDIECNKKSKPAINKLTGFDSIAQKLKHKNIQGEFLMNGGLDKFVKWLSKMPDGSQPSQPLKKKVLQLIQKFTVDREIIIKSSSLGKIIMGYNKSQSEPADIRQMAKGIVNNWSRIISENVIDYHQQNDYDEDYDKEELDQIKKKLQINRQSSNQDIELLNNKKVSKFVELPDTKNYAFYFNPKPMDDDDDNEGNVQEVSEKTKEAFKNLADLTRKKTR